MAKDLIILSGKNTFTKDEIKALFDDKIILMYLNEMILELSNRLIHFLDKKGDVNPG